MITLIFTSGDSWLSKAIKWFTKSKSSHVLIGCDLQGIPCLLHSSAGGVQVDIRKKWMKGNTIVAEYEILPDLDAGFKQAFRMLGDHYDYVGLIGYALLVSAWRWLKIKMKNKTASPTSVVCSEFILSLDDGTNIPEWKGLDPERTSPQTLLDVMGSSFRRIR